MTAFLTVEKLPRGRKLEAQSIIRDAIRSGCGVDHLGCEKTITAWMVGARAAMVTADEVLACRHTGYPGLKGIGAWQITPHDAFQHFYITLNYVSPSAAGRGISTRLMDEMERSAVAAGYRVCHLYSTMSSRGFYHRRGYEPNGPPWRGVGYSWNFPMIKNLDPNG